MKHQTSPQLRLPGIVAASGLSERMGTPKALLDASGRTFVDRIIRALGGGGCDPVVVVIRDLAGPIAIEARRNGGVPVLNPDPTPGPISSLQAGIRTLPGDTEGILFTPVDHPLFTESTVEALREAFRRTRAPAVLPVHRGRRGHPVLFSEALFQELLEDQLDEGARTVLRRYVGSVVEVPVNDPGILADIDTWDDYRRHIP